MQRLPRWEYQDGANEQAMIEELGARTSHSSHDPILH